MTFSPPQVFSRIGISHSLEQQVDLRDLEAGERQVEVDVQFGDVAELQRQKLLIPAGVQGTLVVGDDVSALLRLAEMVESHRGHLFQPQQAGGGDPAMTGDDAAVAVDQHRGGDAPELGV